jgi:hypothetical protein
MTTTTVYKLTINDKNIGIFKTLREAKAFVPDMSDALDLGINTFNNDYLRVITPIQFEFEKNYFGVTAFVKTGSNRGFYENGIHRTQRDAIRAYAESLTR